MWYKKSQQIFDGNESFKIDNFSDRNLVNSRIQSLTGIADMLDYCARLVHQTQRGARGVVAQLRANKKISSFPIVIELLEQADKVAMDSPLKFADLCKKAAMELDRRISKLSELREEFADGPSSYLKPKKGLF
jgi:hypothetical protein